MKILIAIDGSKFSEDIIHKVRECFNPQTTEVRILQVVTPVEFSAIPEMSRTYAPELDDMGREAHALVEKYAEEMRGAGYKTAAEVEMGDACETIVDTATDWEADLIVVGSHGHKGIQRVLLGSVTYSVVKKAHCSVLVVRAAKSKS